MAEKQKKSQARSLETRRRLLDAAKDIFVRDGYERAQLDEIAAAAGRTKGAIYGHFKDKEDLFLALFVERSKQDMDAVVARMGAGTDKKLNLAGLRDFFSGLASDRSWAILMLEFKLYSMRYPEVRRRFRRAYRHTRPGDMEAEFRRVFGATASNSRLEIEGCVAALNPLLCGLVLESVFEPTLFSRNRLPAYLETLFDALIVAENRSDARRPDSISPRQQF
jgi:AcrR family transcriptional regulator